MTQKIEIEYNGVTLVEGEQLPSEKSISDCNGCYFFTLGGYGCQSPNSLCIENEIIWKRKNNMQNWKQLELFDEDGEIFREDHICADGVEYIPKIVQPEDTFEACNNCEFTSFVHACMKAKCVPTERQDQQEVIWIRKEAE